MTIPASDAPSLIDEQLLTLGEAARRFPGHRGAGRLSPSTVWRWVVEGVATPGGHRLRLEAVRVGCRWLTSEAALRRFADRLTAPLREPAARAAEAAPAPAVDRVDAELDRRLGPRSQ